MSDILKKTLAEMKSVFSSNEFSKKAKKNGLSEKEIANGVIALFLHQNAIQMDSRRMWKKYNGVNLNDLSDAIQLLKSHGYKVMKPVNDWVEV